MVIGDVAHTSFYGSLMQPPVYMVGEYFTLTTGTFNTSLYVVPTIYIDAASSYAPVDGSYVFMFAQFSAPSRL